MFQGLPIFSTAAGFSCMFATPVSGWTITWESSPVIFTCPLQPCPLLGKPMALSVQVRKHLLRFAGRLGTAAVTRAVTQSGTGTILSSESSGPLCWTAAKTTGNRTVHINEKESCASPAVLAFLMTTSVPWPVLITFPYTNSEHCDKMFFPCSVLEKTPASSWRWTVQGLLHCDIPGRHFCFT